MQAPERLGKYQIRRELGRGAMGVVYEGHDPFIERAVAIKVLRLDESNAELAAELRMRFRREAQAAGRLGHPGIVAVYEYGEDADAGSAFIAMELVRGRDLKSLFDAGKRFTLAETGRLMDELLAALQHAHERGVVHRDIKPGNIILLDSGGLKVADFGIAKLDTSELTQLGSVLGTVSHMAPEQLTGEPVDRRSDLYSCGVILYQLLTGERPFTGPPASLMHKVLHEEPLPPSQRTPGLPAALDAVVLKAMAKSADRRHPDARAFAADLHAALTAPIAVDDDATVVQPRPAPADAAGHATGDATWPLKQDRTVPMGRPGMQGTLPGTAAGSTQWPSTVAGTATGLGRGADTLAGTTPGPAQPSMPPTGAPPGRGVRGIGIAVLGVVGVVAAGAGAWRFLTPRAEPLVQPDAVHVAAASASVPASAITPDGTTPATVPGPTTPTVALAAPMPLATPSVPSSGNPSTTANAPGPQAVAATPMPPAIVAIAPAAPPAAPAPKPAQKTTTAPSPSPTALAAPPPAMPAIARAAAPAPQLPPAPPPQTPDRRVALAPAPATPATSYPPAPAPRTAPSPAPASPYGTSPNASTRADECLEDARRGNARCQVTMGNAYRIGRGVPRDPVEAARWYRLAAEQGSDAGQYELGILYENGIGVARDPNAAVAWYRKAASQGYARAQNTLGRAYETGLATSTNYVLAADWYGRAAEQNLSIAQYNLARLYLQGRGVFKDAAKAHALLQKAADAGEPNAMVYVAEMYAKGDGKPRDRDQATRLFRDALSKPGLNDRNRETAERALASAK
jgi:TPR repeat protein/tRNA A-37 threonylcarbamoyl transferase component Bud32